MKRSMLILLAVLMLLLAPATQLRANAAETGTCGENLTWTLDDAGTLTISGTGAMTDYSYISSLRAPWYSQREAILSLVVEDGVTRIGNYAFDECTNLNVVHYGGTSAQKAKLSIGYFNGPLENVQWHYGCDGTNCPGLPPAGTCGENLTWTLDNGTLTISGTGAMDDYYTSSSPAPWYSYRESIQSVVLENSVTTIGNYAFYGYSNLSNITIGDGVTTIGKYAFYDCTALSSITIPGSVTTIGNHAFNGCTGLTVVHYTGTFQQKTAITFGSSNSYLIGAQWHYGCDGTNCPGLPPTGTCGENLTWILDSTGTLTVSGTGAMSYSTHYAPWNSLSNNILSVVLADGITSIDSYAFFDHMDMTSITIPASVTSISDFAFHGCYDLSVVHYTGTFPQKEAIDIASGNSYLLDAQWDYGCDGTNCPGLPPAGTCGDNLTWTLDDTGTLTVSGTGAMYDYTSETEVPWYPLRESILSVVLEDGVTSICKYAFSGYSSLTGISIPDSVTSIGDYAFKDCTGLISINIPDGVTTIGEDAFSCCTNLSSVTLGNAVATIGDGAFTWCTNLSSVTLGNAVTTIGKDAFSCCTSLSSISIPDGVTAIGDGAFNKCTGLSSITIPDGVTTIGENTFFGCSSLTSINIPDGVTSIGDYAFYYCTSLTSISIPDGVTTIGDHAFDYCPVLTSINIPDGVTSIGMYTFCDCTSLTDIVIPESVTSIGDYAFHNCAAVSVVHYGGTEAQRARISIGSENWRLEDAQWHYGCDSTNCPGVPPATTSGTCGENLTWTLDDGTLTISGTGAMYDYTSETEVPWYSHRESIQSVVVEDCVTTIGDFVFRGCPYLSSVTIGKDVTRIGVRAIADCESLVSITIPGNVATIGRAAFNGCTNLSSVTFGDGVTTIGDESFTFCTSLTSITFPDSVTTIDDWSFMNCENLSSVTFGNGVTTIGEWAFCECNLDSITIPDSVTTIVGTAFQNCRNLRSVTLGKGITTIEVGTFMNCSSLNDIIIPNTVTTIDDYAFYNCTALSVVHYGGTEAQRAEISIDSNNAVLENAQWHYECDGTNCPASDPSTPPKETPFVDVAGDAYYFDPVLWAVENGITNGLDATHFAPDATCTRAQVVTFLWRAKGCPEPKMVYNPFSDVSSDDYYYSAVLWAAETGITTGTSSNTFDPHAECTRGQVATFLWRAQGKPASGGSNSFTDVASGAYYYDAVLWAVENGITNGIGGSIFAPDATCTRGQIVTFLYRAMK